MTVNFKPLNGNLLAAPDIEKQTSGGILIPETAKNQPRTGTVVAAMEDSDVVKVGDRIHFGKYVREYLCPTGRRGDQEYLLMQESDLLLVNGQPITDRVIIKPNLTISHTSNGVLLPDTLIRDDTKGVVVGVGIGKMFHGTLRPNLAQIGDVVFFGPDIGMPITLAGKDLLMMRDDDILGVIEEDK